MLTVLTAILALPILALHSSANNGVISAVIATIVIFLISFGLIMDIGRSKSLRKYKVQLYLGLLWRLLLLYFDRYGASVYQLPNSGVDSSMFYRTAVAFSNGGSAGRGGAFATLLGSIFRATGSSQLFGQFIVLLFSMIALCVFARVIEDMALDEHVKRRAVGVLALLPNFAILSSIFLRESIVCMFITLSLAVFYLWQKRGNEGFFLLALACALLGALFHSGSVAVAVGLIAVRLLYSKKKRAFSVSLSNILPVLILSLGLIFLYLNYGDAFFGKMFKVDSIDDIAGVNTSGGSSYARFVGDSATPLNMVVYTIPRIVYFLFSPFPWQWRGLNDIIAFAFSSLFYLITLVRTLRYLHSRKPENRALLISLLIIAACAVFVFAWGVSNTGTAARHRDKLILLFGLMYAISHREGFQRITVNKQTII